MKTKVEIEQMISRIEKCDGLPSVRRMVLLMALEWVLDESVSTSLGLEEWLNEQEA